MIGLPRAVFRKDSVSFVQALVIFNFMFDYFTHMPGGGIYIIGAPEQYSQDAGPPSASQARVLPRLPTDL